MTMCFEINCFVKYNKFYSYFSLVELFHLSLNCTVKKDYYRETILKIYAYILPMYITKDNDDFHCSLSSIRIVLFSFIIPNVCNE